MARLILPPWLVPKSLINRVATGSSPSGEWRYVAIEHIYPEMAVKAGGVWRIKRRQ